MSQLHSTLLGFLNRGRGHVRAGRELLPHPTDHRSCELQMALRLIRLAHDG